MQFRQMTIQDYDSKQDRAHGDISQWLKTNN